MKKPTLFFRFALLCPLIFSGVAAAEDPDAVDKLQRSTKQAIELASEPLEKFDKRYVTELEKLKASVQKKGDLQRALTVDKEIESFAKDSERNFERFPEIQRLRKIFEENRPQIEEEVAAKRLVILKQSEVGFQQLTTELTKQGNLEAAQRADEARKEVIRQAALLSDGGGPTGPENSPESAFPLLENPREGTEPGETVMNGTGMALCWIPKGSFLMGSPPTEEGRGGDENQIRTRLTAGFWMGKFEVTQGQFEEVMGRNPSRPGSKLGKDYPVEQVTWSEAAEYCEKLTTIESGDGNLTSGWTYRLPTEAEWEWACRAGTSTAYFFGESARDLKEYGNFAGNEDGHAGFARVGTFKPNPWGLHDMLGNAWEWCHDYYAPSLEGGVNPEGPETGTKRLNRGAGIISQPGGGRSAFRYANSPMDRYAVGFRVVLSE